jgi:hypothetical protein
MKNNLFILLSTLMFCKANCQNSSTKDTSVNYNTATYTGNIHTSGLWIPSVSVENSVKGTVYLFSNFTGVYNVISKKGDSFNLSSLNYNIKTNSLETFVSKDSVFQYDLNQIDYVVNKNNKYKVNSSGNLKGLSLEVYNTDKIQFFKTCKVVTEKAVINPMTNAVISAAEYTHVFSYYLYIKGIEVKIKLNKKDVLDALKDKKNPVKDYVELNNLNYTNIDDVCKILKYYESI